MIILKMISWYAITAIDIIKINCIHFLSTIRELL